MKFLDSITRFFNQRKRSNGRREYSAAVSNRLVSDWVAANTSQDSEASGALGVLRNRARDSERNNDWVRAFLSWFEVNVVGKGFRMQSNVLDKDENPAADINKKIEKEWKKWCKSDSCDVTGKQSFAAMQRMIIRSIGRDGETPLIRFVYARRGRSKVKLSLQLLEPDRLDETFNRQANEKENAIRMSVEVDSFGKPVAYWILEKHPGDSGRMVDRSGQRRIRVPAKDIIHDFMAERVEQTRAVTLLASALSTIRQLKGFIDASVIRKRVEAAVMWFVQNEDGEAPSGEVLNNERVTDASPASVHYLNNNETIVKTEVQSNSGSDATFTASMLQNVAAGTGGSYEGISKDFSKTNYSSSRLSLQSSRDLCEIIQSWFAEAILQKIFEKWFEVAFLSDVFDYQDYSFNEEKYNEPRWMPRGWDWVDPLKDILATKEALKSNLTTMSDVLAKRGLDFEETMLRIQKERARMTELGISSDILNETLLDQQMKQTAVTEAITDEED